MTKSADPIGFSGLASLSSKIEDFNEQGGETDSNSELDEVREQQQNIPANHIRGSSSKLKSQDSKNGTNNPTSKRWSLALLVIFLIYGGSLLLSLFEEGYFTTHQGTSENNGTKYNPPSDADLVEVSKPPKGIDRVYTKSEIRWCLREKIELEVLRELIFSSQHINEFNTMIQDYNTRCGYYKYREQTLKSAKRDLDIIRPMVIHGLENRWRSQIMFASNEGEDPSLLMIQSRRDFTNLDYVREVQNALTLRGYDPGPIDGEYGSQTKVAILAFQRDNDLFADGVISREFLSQLDLLIHPHSED